MMTDPAVIHARINATHRYQREAPGRDDWLTPAEFDARGGGDCEDFAIAYWHALRDAPGRACLGWCLGDSRESHMVCLYYPPGADDPQVLDVLVDAVCGLSARPDLVLMAELDPAGLRLPSGRAGRKVPARWGRVLERIAVDDAQALEVVP